ncbi:MAG: glucose-6-phosphate isomerase [Bacteroidales bacterium]
MDITLRFDNALSFLNQEEIELYDKEIKQLYDNIYQRQGQGNEYLGWVDLPSRTPQQLLEQLQHDALKIKDQSQVVVVTGIGGSYLGSRAVIEALGTSFQEILSAKAGAFPKVLFAGHHLDEDYLFELLNVLDQVDYSVIVISKSGTTTEPAVAFRLLKDHLEEKYGKQAAAQRIYAVTDASSGALRKLTNNEGYSSYVIPDDVGGRYSVLTPVGLLPIAVAGFNIEKLIQGARQMEDFLKNHQEVMENPAAQYAVIRNLLYRQGKTTEIMAGYNPRLFYLIEWWKQLFGESEGKDQKGIFPAGVGFTTDLHSLGQYMQDGLRNIFETVITVANPLYELRIPNDKDNLDGLNYLSGKRISYVNRMASQGTMLAHVDGGVPNLEIVIPRLDEHVIGQLIYFFEMSCAYSGYMLGVNPFDQPGVEAYKKNMFALLEKPGFEKEGRELKNRLKQ